jgi:hypothetical protein
MANLGFIRLIILSFVVVFGGFYKHREYRQKVAKNKKYKAEISLEYKGGGA